MPTAVESAPRSTVDQALVFVLPKGPRRPVAVSAYIREVYRLGTKVGIDPTFVVAQAYLECRNRTTLVPFSSNAWVDHLNPAGIGITDSGPQSMLSTQDPIVSARVHVTHVAGYIQGKAPWIIEAGYDKLDPRWQALIDSGRMGTIDYVEQFGSGVWATAKSSEYATNILTFMNQIKAVK